MEVLRRHRPSLGSAGLEPFSFWNCSAAAQVVIHFFTNLFMVIVALLGFSRLGHW